jgi:hypothetical protein
VPEDQEELLTGLMAEVAEVALFIDQLLLLLMAHILYNQVKEFAASLVAIPILEILHFL